MKFIQRLPVIEIGEYINTLKLRMLPRSEAYLTPEGRP
jgi:hypothetical protein